MAAYILKIHRYSGRAGIIGWTESETEIDAENNAEAETKAAEALVEVDWNSRFASLTEVKGPYFKLWQFPHA
jgi:hypothetical protein